ncbi:unnamed protein product [Boreogadus saida]
MSGTEKTATLLSVLYLKAALWAWASGQDSWERTGSLAGRGRVLVGLVQQRERSEVSVARVSAGECERPNSPLVEDVGSSITTCEESGDP